ncbi:MAG: LysR substrate-binding domain-containing protein [Motiliproteus sp.]
MTRCLLARPRGWIRLPVAEALQQLIKLVTPADFDPKALDRTFTLAIADPVAARLIPVLVNRLAVEAPGVALRLRGYTGDSVRSMSKGTLDFVCGLVQENLPAGAHARILIQYEICCLVRASHPLAGRARMTIEQFVAYEHIKPWFRGINDKGILDLKLKEMGLSRTIRLESSHTLTILRTLQCTDTLLVGMSDWTKLLEGGDLVKIALPDPFESHFGSQANMHLLWDERNHSDPAHRWLRQLMVDVASEETGRPSFSDRDSDA